ncbi:MAG: hypothetical protein ACRDJW_10725 [Thermomicrobiales bacterium]
MFRDVEFIGPRSSHSRPATFSWGSAGARNVGLVQITTEEGAGGYGETSVTFPLCLHVPRDNSSWPLRSEVLASPLWIEGGRAWLPDGPGRGVEINAAAIERYRVVKGGAGSPAGSFVRFVSFQRQKG